MERSTAAPATAQAGLAEEEAARRLRARGPLPEQATSRSYLSIVRANTLTVFNAILAVFGALTLVFGEWRDALFLGILVANTAIGIAQEVRAKLALDRLAALVAPSATVVRDGAARSVPVGEVVAGDLVRLAPGDQVVADGELAAAEGLAVDESILTGESEAVVRAPGEPVWSGTFAVEGNGAYVVTAVGPDSRAAQLTATARAFRHPRSPLERAMDRLLLTLAAIGAPLAILLTASLVLRDRDAAESVQVATAAIVNMVPEGLILLVSLTAAVSAVKMARRGVLAQQLNAIESLASVDVFCSDKTGTLTEPSLRVVGVRPADGVAEDVPRRALARFAAAAPSPNATLAAVGDAGLDPGDGGGSRITAEVPFSSARRWSALEVGGERIVLGAPERFAGADPGLAARAASEAAAGRRVLAVGTTPAPLPAAAPDAPFPEDVLALGIVVLAERLRPDADRTVAFLTDEDVLLRVLSGDAPATVGAIARDAGVPGEREALDGESLPEDPGELRDAVLAAPAVGRISPDGKRRVVESLRESGRYVGMVGDGVNDVPALKAARLAIAQGTGTQMARSVSDLVLVNGDFAAVPPMVAEGRQILRNIQRVARLFVTKSVYAAFLLVAVGITTATYPLLPRHFTIASTLTIGIPSFVLALAPSSGPWRPDRFLAQVARFAIPAGLAIGAGIALGYALARGALDLPRLEARTAALGIVVVCGLAVVMALEAEPGRRRVLVGALCALMLLCFAALLALPGARSFFELAVPTGEMAAAWAAGTALGLALMALGLRLARRFAPPPGD